MTASGQDGEQVNRQARIIFDPAGSGLSEHGVHHFHGLVLDAYRRLAPPSR